MAFGLNRVELIGRLGADVTVNHLTSGGRVANLSVATDESYINKQSGERVDKTEWHRIVTFQDGLISMFEKHAKKGRLVYIDGKLQTRRWTKPGEDGDRFSTEILLVPGGRVQFLDKPNGNGAPMAEGQAPANGSSICSRWLCTPTFRGSFSLKRVVPARVPGIGYDDLAIADGQSAAVRYAAALASPDRNERRRIFDALRAYCARDALAMLEVRRAPMVIATAGVPRNRPTAVGGARPR